jgi:hypothetical protein
VAFDGTTIVSGSFDKTVRIRRAPFNTAEYGREIGEHTYWVERVWLCTAPSEHIVVSAGGSRVHVCDMRTGKLVCEPIECDSRKLP